MVRTAHNMGLLTTPYAFKPEEGEQMVEVEDGEQCGEEHREELCRCQKHSTGGDRHWPAP